MNQDFNQCLQNKKILPFASGKKLVKKEITVAQSDLADAKAGYENARYKWSTIQAYYAMFHAARALIYAEATEKKAITAWRLQLRRYLWMKVSWTPRHPGIFSTR